MASLSLSLSLSTFKTALVWRHLHPSVAGGSCEHILVPRAEVPTQHKVRVELVSSAAASQTFGRLVG
jgi:hypothetical protein